MLDGSGTTSPLLPKYAPAKVRGSETPNHNVISSSRVRNGMAPEECWPEMRKLMTKKMPNAIPGYRNIDSSVQRFQCTPLNIL